MQRLRARGRDRLRGERGAVSVVVALLMIPLIGFAAIAVDVAALYSERVQLQNGADAAALAIAQDCARGACGVPVNTAAAMTAANHDAQGSTLGTPTVAMGNGQVSVTNRGTQDHWFAPVLGFDSTGVSAAATVRWGAPVSGTSVVPLIFSTCEFRAQTNGGLPSSTTAYTIRLTKSSDTGCTGPSGNYVPGGFGWLTTNGTGCRAATSIGQWVDSDPGNSPSNGCSATTFAQVRGQSVLLPVFQDYRGQGNNASYGVYGYAAFVVTGYYFAGQYSWNAPCSGNDRCVRGYFTRFVDLDDTFTYGPTAPDLGARVVDLIR
ncbi:MAG: hypothetical protein JWQ53_2097 [Klenkia sp.]|nr:hypothetical protein [Klenkia sp.]